MLNILIATCVLGLWAYFDWKTGKVYNILLILPVILLPFTEPGLCLWALLVASVCLFMFKVMKEIGFADVIAIPYTMFYVFLAGLPLMAAFPIFLWIFLIKITRKDKGHGKGLYNTCYIRFIPLLFWSFVLSALIHVIILNFEFLSSISWVWI